MDKEQKKLVGYVRKSKTARELKVNVSKKAIENTQSYKTRDGKEYVSLIIDLEKLMDLIAGERDFVPVEQVVE